MKRSLYTIGVVASVMLLTACAGKRKIIDPPMLPKTSVQVPKGAIEVTIKKEGDGFILMREGKPYYINGAGYGRNKFEDYYHMKLLADMGGNSVRTWGVGDLAKRREYMDKAYEYGLTVDFGMWINHQRHGFDYDNEAALEKRFNEFKDVVMEFKDHPALLMWNLGNEVTMAQPNYNKKVWNFINRVAKMIKEVDGKHPTLTTVHQVNKDIIESINERAPEIDILGINKYGGMGSAIRAAPDLGWDKPIVVTEFGTRGAWEVSKTTWGAPLEPSGISKSTLYKNSIRSIKSFNKCVGSYAFLWGEKQEVTKTWYGLVFGRGRTIGAADELSKAWTGKYPDNRAPFIQSFRINGKTSSANLTFELGETITATVVGKDRDDNPDDLVYHFTLRDENLVTTSGGDFQSDPSVIVMDNLEEDGGTITFDVPVIPGPYRLYVIIYDSQGKICNGNFPIMVN